MTEPNQYGPRQLLFDEPSRDSSALRMAAREAGYEGSMVRAFVLTVVGDDLVAREILVTLA